MHKMYVICWWTALIAGTCAAAAARCFYPAFNCHTERYKLLTLDVCACMDVIAANLALDANGGFSANGGFTANDGFGGDFAGLFAANGAGFVGNDGMCVA